VSDLWLAQYVDAAASSRAGGPLFEDECLVGDSPDD